MELHAVLKKVEPKNIEKIPLSLEKQSVFFKNSDYFHGNKNKTP